MVTSTNTERVVHVRFAGRSLDLPLRTMRLAQLPSDTQVKDAVARELDVQFTELRDYVVDRHETGNLTVRPIAVFG